MAETSDDEVAPVASVPPPDGAAGAADPAGQQAAVETAPEPDSDLTAQSAPEPAVEVEEAVLPEAVPAAKRAGAGQLDLLLDATVRIDARLGSAELEVRDLLQLGQGSIVTLDKEAGKPIDLLLNGVPFATGTVVLVGDQLGVRIREIVPSPK